MAWPNIYEGFPSKHIKIQEAKYNPEKYEQGYSSLQKDIARSAAIDICGSAFLFIRAAEKVSQSKGNEVDDLIAASPIQSHSCIKWNLETKKTSSVQSW